MVGEDEIAQTIFASRGMFGEGMTRDIFARFAKDELSIGDLRLSVIYAKRDAKAVLALFQEASWQLVPKEPTEAMTQAAQTATAAWLNLEGSGLTKALTKHAIRYRAMLAAATG